MVIVFAVLTIVGFIAILFVIRRAMRWLTGNDTRSADPSRATVDLLGTGALTDDERAALRKRAAEMWRGSPET